MSEDNIIGYRCPACKLLNTADRSHCSQCGHWLLDSAYPAEVVTKAEYFKAIKKSHEKTKNVETIIILKTILGFVIIVICIALFKNLITHKNNASPSISNGKAFENHSTINGSLLNNNTFNQPIQAIPENGTVFKYSTRDCIAPFGIATGSDNMNYYVKLSEWNTKKPVISIFVRAGQNANIKVPLGSYEIKFASGKTWYGENYLFGNETVYTKATQKIDFYMSGNTIKGYTIQLYQQVGGNLKTEKINSKDF